MFWFLWLWCVVYFLVFGVLCVERMVMDFVLFAVSCFLFVLCSFGAVCFVCCVHVYVYVWCAAFDVWRTVCGFLCMLCVVYCVLCVVCCVLFVVRSICA